MKYWVVCSCLGLFILVGAVSASAQGGEPNLEQRVRQLEERLKALEENPNQPDTFRVYWKQGLRLDTEDKAFRLKIGGRIMNDWGFFFEDDGVKAAIGTLEDGTEFRRARLYMSGLVYDRVEFKAQYDFAGGDVDFKDVYIGLRKLPLVGTVRVGHQKEPFSLEELTSSKYITFMERALPNVFSPSRNTGIRLHNQGLNHRLTWAVGLFRDTDGFGDRIGDGEYNVTARLTGLPWYQDKGQRLLHLGTAYSHQKPHNDVKRFRERPEAHLAERFVDTGSLSVEAVDLIGAEAALVLGPASLQGEYIHAFVNGLDGPNPDFFGFYVMGSYFLTGEHRPYSRSSGPLAG